MIYIFGQSEQFSHPTYAEMMMHFFTLKLPKQAGIFKRIDCRSNFPALEDNSWLIGTFWKLKVLHVTYWRNGSKPA